ncbi:hypothetical protein CNBE2920 [Cryptococcus deneoformans B-3501A]|uniref:Sialidase domain-containing protein n=1 Tax=Cryptococcus deneoformans (strain JEC21 / ATCC MYA-565) TaxID=214684 RepID=Q5KGN6_CRYD1|nr:conserved hypothetical protein [Cryptococcus neoformans var. neoformans JEC21]XP_775578.1 hypothetical protein CNBE2920 [Cryptococcus neoformans var. neoformans B-3501A]AAW43695.1 conserved hypothetical protein [Cryptococcus neoformans var. neoformans JEC21]EAL20931.1 hypothetical protein CNBE2920 [Cryptococcus neoformans var. neoformans B-3501A]
MTTPKIQREYLFKDDPRQPEVHCSTIQAACGVEYVTWFGGTKEGTSDVKIWFSKCTNGCWTPPRVIAGSGDIVHWNPVSFLPDPKGAPGHLYVFYKTGTPIPTWKTYVIETIDGGNTWTEPRELVPGDHSGGRGPQKNPPIVLSNGDWLSGASKEVTLEGGKGLWDAFADIAPTPKEGDTFKQGERWVKAEFIKLPADRGVEGGSFPGEGIIQPSLWESADKPGHVHMMCRSSIGRIVRADSEDYGRTWTPGYATDLPNNNSGQCVTRLRDGRLVAAVNDVYKNWGPRTPLVLKVSFDDGETWSPWCTLEDQAPPASFQRVIALETGIVNDGKSEFSYPTVTPTAETDEIGVWVSYTWQRRGIAVCKVTDGE